MTLDDIRAQYPQYNDMSDKQLSDSLYKAHYSDMDKSTFESKLSSSDPKYTDVTGQEYTPSKTEQALDSGAKAIVGGLSTGAADIAQGIGDTPTAIMKALHFISPETAAKLYQATKENSDMFRPQTGESNEVGQAMDQNPTLAKISKTGVDIAGVLTLAKGIPAVGEAASQGATALGAGPLISGGAGVVARGVGQGLLGQGMVDPANKTQAGVLNAVIGSPVSDLLGKGISMLGNKVSATDYLKNVLDKYSTTNVNKAYQTVRDLPFATADKVNANTVSQNIGTFLKTNADSLQPTQTNILTDVSKQLANASSHDDTLKALQQLNSKTRAFSGINADDSLYGAYKGFKSDISNVINESASRTEAGNVLDQANDLYKQNKAVTKTVGGVNTDPNNYNFSAAYNRVNTAITKYQDTPGMSDTVKTLQGIQKVIGSVAKYGSDNSISSGITKAVTQHIAGGVVGGAAGYKEDGAQGSVAGTIAGGLAGPKLMEGVKWLAETSSGQNILRGLAHPGMTQNNVNAVVRSIAAAIIAKNQPTGTNNGQ